MSRLAPRTLHRVLPCGITVDIVENHSGPMVALHGILLAGEATAPRMAPALPELTGIMIQRGTGRRSRQEINALKDTPLECVLVRSDNESVVVNLSIEAAERVEEVYWIDPVHPA